MLREMKMWLTLAVAFLPPLTSRAGQVWTLEEALREGQLRNPDALIAQQRITAARAVLDQANAAFWPRVEFQSSYTRTDNPMQAFGSILNQRVFSPSFLSGVPDVDNLNAKGLLTVPLYAGGRNQSTRQAALANSQAAHFEGQAVINLLAFEITRAFFDIIKSRAFVRAATATVKAFESNVDIAKKRLEGGSILKTDLLDLEVRLAQAREDAVRAQNAVHLTQRALRDLIGVETSDFDVADTAPGVSIPNTTDFSRRPELGAAQARQRAAQKQVRAAQAGYLPRVSAFGSLDYDYGWRFEHGGGSYMGGALFQWDIWDGRLSQSKAREAGAGLETSREEERKLRLALDFEVEKARLDLATANERLRVTQSSIDQATESASIFRSRFEQGLALSTQVIDAETALLAARVRRAEAEADQRIAIAALRKAVALPQLDPSSLSTPQK